jgi:hypothetical protein
MRRRFATVLVSLGLVAFGGAAAYAASGGVPGSSHDRSAAAKQYGERPGKGCGDRNHVHTGPPGNPSNTSCPPQSQHQGGGSGATEGTSSVHRHAKKHGRHAKKHARHAKKHARHGKRH